MFENIKQNLDEKGYHVGQVSEFYLNMLAYKKLATEVCTVVYEQEKANKHVKWMNCIAGPIGSQYPNDVLLDKIDERKKFIKDNGLGIDQQWQYFGGAKIKEFTKIVETLVFHLYKDLSPANIRHNPKFTLYQDEDFTDLHIDDYTIGRKCAVLLYLSSEQDYNDGGGKLLLTSKKTKKLRIAETLMPVAPNYAIIDTEKHQLYHGVEPVKNGFKRFAFLDFIFLDSEKDV